MTRKEAVLKELNTITQKHDGMLRPVDVVEFAKNERTVLHSCFTWNNTEAAEQWRIHQARMLIRVTVAVFQDDDETEYRAFVSLKDDRYGHLGYRPMISILGDGDLTEKMLEEALEEMATFKEKYKQLHELVAVFAEIDKVKMERRRRKSSSLPVKMMYARPTVSP